MLLWVIVDLLTKSTYFNLVKNTIATNKLGQLYVEQIMRLHKTFDYSVGQRHDFCIGFLVESLQVTRYKIGFYYCLSIRVGAQEPIELAFEDVILYQ